MDEIRIPRTMREKLEIERERLYALVYKAEAGYSDLIEGKVSSYTLGNRSLSRTQADLKTLMDFVKQMRAKIDEIEAILQGRGVRTRSTNVCILLWLHPFILSGVISPLICSSRLGTCQPEEAIFQYPIFLHFQAVHGVLNARILKWFAIPFSSGPHSVRPLHHDPPVLGGPTGHGLVSLR